MWSLGLNGASSETGVNVCVRRTIIPRFFVIYGLPRLNPYID